MPDYQNELQSSAAAARRRAVESEPSVDRGDRPHPLVRLQNHIGNAQVARLIAQRQEVADEEEDLQAKHDPSLLQRQEVAEEEEDLQAKHDPTLISRQAAPAIGLEGGPVGDDMARRIDSVRGSGPGLSEATRSKMEPAFGTDFSGVRVHQDSESDALARSMTAKAFTTGSDIFLRQDASPGDTSLLAHELTHVVQQNSGATDGAGGMNVGPAGDPLEHQADSVAQAVVSGQSTQRRVDEGHPS